MRLMGVSEGRRRGRGPWASCCPRSPLPKASGKAPAVTEARVQVSLRGDWKVPGSAVGTRAVNTGTRGPDLGQPRATARKSSLTPCRCRAHSGHPPRPRRIPYRQSHAFEDGKS